MVAKTVKEKLMRAFYKRWPPSLSDARKAVSMLNPGCRLVHFSLYSSGYEIAGMATTEDLYFEGYTGSKPPENVKPVYKWGITRLKYGDKIVSST